MLSPLSVKSIILLYYSTLDSKTPSVSARVTASPMVCNFACARWDFTLALLSGDRRMHAGPLTHPPGHAIPSIKLPSRVSAFALSKARLHSSIPEQGIG